MSIAKDRILVDELGGSSRDAGADSEWVEWHAAPEARASAMSQAERRQLRDRWEQTIIASCVEPEGPRRLFGLVVPNGEAGCGCYRAALEAAIARVVKPLREIDVMEDLMKDDTGAHIPGAVLRDVTISLGGEVVAIVKVGEEGPCVIRLPRADLGRDLFLWEGPFLESGAVPTMERVPNEEHLAYIIARWRAGRSPRRADGVALRPLPSIPADEPRGVGE